MTKMLWGGELISCLLLPDVRCLCSNLAFFDDLANICFGKDFVCFLQFSVGSPPGNENMVNTSIYLQSVFIAALLPLYRYFFPPFTGISFPPLPVFLFLVYQHFFLVYRYFVSSFASISFPRFPVFLFLVLFNQLCLLSRP